MPLIGVLGSTAFSLTVPSRVPVASVAAVNDRLSDEFFPFSVTPGRRCQALRTTALEIQLSRVPMAD